MDAISVGTVVGGRYRVVEPIGEGSMGAVYRVEQVDSHEVWALKLLHADLGRHPEIIARFEREAIAASRIEHPNVVHATDFGCSADGSFFLVLDFVDGRDLRVELHEGPMEAGRAINIMRGVVAGIRAAHERGVIHRDLKPENIMLVERDGNRDFVKLLDFGIARLESASNPQSGMQPLTVVGRPLGTPEYMSPEQVLGTPVDARSDLYSLGVIFFELLTGSCPFDGNVSRLLQQHLTSEPPELPAAVAAEHPDLARIVRMLLAKTPKNRFQTAAELAEALNASAGGQTGQRARGAPIAPPEPESRTLA
jgi:eukaryotic-like serine/threonine-protein kinase